MSRFVRPSKYRHVYPNVAKKEACYENVKVSNNAWDTNLVAANGKYISINWNSSGGGAFAVLPINRPGKLPDIYPLCRGHTATVLDTAFSPFEVNFVASASDDGTIGLWKIDDANFDQLEWSDKERERNGGVKDFEPIARVSGGGRKIGQVVWHPTASNLLAAATGDHVKLFDVSNASTAASSPSISLRGFTDTIQSLDWDWSGTTLIATSRDRKIRTFDPRAGENAVQTADSHGGIKGARVVWCGDKDRAITTGFSKMSDRQMFLWDTKNLAAGPLKQVTLDSSSGIIMPFWSDNNIVFLAGKGDGNIRYYELENDELHYLTESKSSEPQRGLTFVPRRFLNTEENEIAKAYKITGTTIQPVSFCVPRKAEGFQSDIFPPAPSAEAALSAKEFFDGKRAQRNLISLETGKGVSSSGRVPEAASTKTASASAPTPANAPAPTQTQALQRSVSPTKSSPLATPRAAEEPKSTFSQLKENSTTCTSTSTASANAPAAGSQNGVLKTATDGNGGKEVEQLKKELEKLRTAVEERDTKIRQLEQENETLKANQRKAREALLNSL